MSLPPLAQVQFAHDTPAEAAAPHMSLLEGEEVASAPAAMFAAETGPVPFEHGPLPGLGWAEYLSAPLWVSAELWEEVRRAEADYAALLCGLGYPLRANHARRELLSRVLGGALQARDVVAEEHVRYSALEAQRRASEAAGLEAQASLVASLARLGLALPEPRPDATGQYEGYLSRVGRAVRESCPDLDGVGEGSAPRKPWRARLGTLAFCSLMGIPTGASLFTLMGLMDPAEAMKQPLYNLVSISMAWAVGGLLVWIMGELARGAGVAAGNFVREQPMEEGTRTSLWTTLKDASAALVANVHWLMGQTAEITLGTFGLQRLFNELTTNIFMTNAKVPAPPLWVFGIIAGTLCLPWALRHYREGLLSGQAAGRRARVLKQPACQEALQHAIRADGHREAATRFEAEKVQSRARESHAILVAKGDGDAYRKAQRQFVESQEPLREPGQAAPAPQQMPQAA